MTGRLRPGKYGRQANSRAASHQRLSASSIRKDWLIRKTSYVDNGNRTFGPLQPACLVGHLTFHASVIPRRGEDARVRRLGRQHRHKRLEIEFGEFLATIGFINAFRVLVENSYVEFSRAEAAQHAWTLPKVHINKGCVGIADFLLRLV